MKLKIRSLSALILSLLIVMSMFTSVYAEPEVVSDVESSIETVADEVPILSILNVADVNAVPKVITVKEVDKIVEQVEGIEENVETPVEIEKVYALFDGEMEVFREGSPEYEALFKGLTKSIIADSKKGLDSILVSSATVDNIKLEVWGEFLNKYIDSTVTKFKAGDIVFKFDNFSFILVNNTSSRKFVVEEIIPTLIEGVKEASLSYPMYEYALDITSGAKLKDFECNLKKVRQVGTVFPLQNLEGYSVYYTGAHYGFAMSSDYTDILRGYIEGDDSGYYRRVEGPKPGCVNVLSYITILNNIKDFTLEDKTLVDFRIYKNLAVRLDTKELIDTTDMTTDNKVLNYEDYKINLDDLILTPISDGVVIVQPKYLECFTYYGYDRNFGRWIDFTNFIETGDKNATVVGNEEIKIPIERFMDNTGMLVSKFGNAPFLMYYGDYVPYDLLVDWSFHLGKGYFETEDAQKDFLNAIKSDLRAEGRKKDYDVYLKAAGQMTSTTKTVVFVLIALVIIGAVVLLLLYIKKKNDDFVQPTSNRDLLFGEDDNDFDNDDDDDVGGFEFK